MNKTDNFNLKLYEGKDLFNPLVVENVNVQAIDVQMKKNENHTVGDATELVSGTVHALTRLTPDTPMLRFTATSRFTSGDTFTVDGVQVSALTVSGEQLPDGAYIIGSEVLAYLKGTLLTFFTSQGTLVTAQNALKLGGNTPEYYATAAAVQQAQDTATAAGNLANEVNSNLNSNLNRNTFGSATEILNQQTFVAPEDGYVIIFSYGGYVECRINGVVMLATHKATYAQTMSLFVRKGMTLSCYSEDATNAKMKFIPLI